MALASLPRARAPLSEINTTPLIDVLLVLLVMLVMTIPVATHSLDADLPKIGTTVKPDQVSNRLRLDADGSLSWNGTAVSDAELAGLLDRTKRMAVIPELQFEPEAEASYLRAAEVLRIVKRAGIAGFGFVGNERYATFGGTG